MMGLQEGSELFTDRYRMCAGWRKRREQQPDQRRMKEEQLKITV